MEVLLKLWRSTLYLRPVGIFLVFVLLILSLLPGNKRRNIPPPIRLYFIAYLLCFIPIDITLLVTNKTARSINGLISYLDYLFTFIECLLLIYYFYLLNQKPKQKKIIIGLFFLFFIVTCVLFLCIVRYDLRPSTGVVWLYTTQVFILLIPAFFYFKKLFQTHIITDISQEPSFWISSGIMLFLLCTMTLSIIESFFLLHKTHILAKLYPIYYVFYILMFLLFFKAYLCKPATSRS